MGIVANVQQIQFLFFGTSWKFGGGSFDLQLNLRIQNTQITRPTVFALVLYT